MDGNDLPLVLAAFKRKHPAAIAAIRTMAAQQGTPVAAAATELMQCLLQVFDEGEQAKWQLRDLLQRVPSVSGGHYLALRYNATEMVYRLAVAGEMDMRETTYFSRQQPPEIANWKSDIPA